MKTPLIALIALVAIAGLAAACSGDDDDGSSTAEIRTNSGLAVAAQAAELGLGASLGGETSNDDSDSAGAAPGVPVGVGDGATRGGFDYSPYFQTGGGEGITVQGWGSASADADSAIVEFYFSRDGYYYDDLPVPEPGGGAAPGSASSGDVDVDTRSSEGDLQAVEPITEDDLQAVIQALQGAGVPADDIEFVNQGYYDRYYASATLRVTIGNLDIVGDAVTVAEGAELPDDIYMSSANVSYTIEDCTALERAAMEAAAGDAADRAGVLADVLDVGLGGIIGAANYSYSPYGGSPCESTYYGPYPLGGIEIDAAGQQTVEVFAQLAVTYAIN